MALFALGASALQSVPAPGVPCVTVQSSSPGYATCDATRVPTDYYTAMKTGVLRLSGLQADTNGAWRPHRQEAARRPAAR